MADYRIYCLDGKGSIGFAQWFEAASDEDAIGRARKLTPDALRCEIWLQGHLVATLDERSQVVGSALPEFGERDSRLRPSQI